AVLVLAERDDGESRALDRAVGDDAPLPLVVPQGPEAARDVVGVEVRPVELRQRLAAVDEAAGDRLADVVVVFPDRLDQVAPDVDPLRAEGVQRLAQVPAVIAPGAEDVDLLIQVLADLAGPERAGLAVECHAPDVADPVRPDLRRGALA